MSFSERKRAPSRIYKTKQWQRARERKLQAVNYQCERCGKVSSRLHVHHKVALEDGGAPFDIENLEALCVSHHSSETMRETHDRKRVEREQNSKHGVMMRDADGWGMSYDERQAAMKRRRHWAD